MSRFERSEPPGPKERKRMIKLKSCPKCGHGDLLLGQDVYGWYMDCLQCGHVIDLEIVKTAKSDNHLPAEVSERVA